MCGCCSPPGHVVSRPGPDGDHAALPGEHQERGGALPLPLPRPHGLGRAHEAPEDGAVHVAAWRGGHGQGEWGTVIVYYLNCPNYLLSFECSLS